MPIGRQEYGVFAVEVAPAWCRVCGQDEWPHMPLPWELCDNHLRLLEKELLAKGFHGEAKHRVR